MATLQKIRNRAGLLVAIVIGFALVAFILGDMFQTGNTFMRSSEMEVAEIDGESVQYQDFQRRIEKLSEVHKMNYRVSQLDENAWTQIRNQAWQEVLRELVMGDAYEELGVNVSSQELFEMINGNNPHRIVQQLFRNPETGVYDKDFAISWLKSLQTNASPEYKAYWLHVENQIKEEKISTKYNNLISKGLYVTTDEATASLAENNKKVNFQYISLKYSDVADSTVVLSDKDLKAYYAAHKDEYKQEQNRKIEYITYEVKASKADDAAARKWMSDIKADFEKASDNEQFVNVNSDTRFEGTYTKREELTSDLAEFAFNGEVGDVYGPYNEMGSYKLAKIDEFAMLPDSVKASHILIKPAMETEAAVTEAQALADSLVTLLKGGASFSKLAKEYSEDPGSAAKGGDLGWFGRNQMVTEFETVAFEGDVNEINKAYTRFGIHIIKTTKKGKASKQVRLAVLDRKVTPSTQTFQDYYTQASKFASENQDYELFKQAVIDQKLSKKTASVKEDDREVTGLKFSRGLIRAAYKANVGDVLVNHEGSTIFEFDDKFVIAALVNATEEGISPFEDVKIRVELAARKEKKAEMLLAKAKEAMAEKDFTALATKLNSEVNDATGVSFSTYSVPGLGMEPAVVGTAASLVKDEVSAPVKGNSGVYIVKTITITEGKGEDVLAEKTRLAQSIGSRAGYMSFKVHQDAVEIDDKRSKFY